MIDDPQAELDRHVAQADANVAGLTAQLLLLREASAEIAERKWAVTLAEGSGRIRHHLSDYGAAKDLVAAFELSRAFSETYLLDIVEEVGAELAEAPPDGAQVRGILRELERLADEGLALDDALFRSSLDVTSSRQEIAAMPKSVAPEPVAAAAANAAASNFDGADPLAGATFVQTVVETLPSREFIADVLSSMVASNATLAAPVQRASGVGTPMARTLDALGMPHTGSALGFATRRDEARGLLVDALKRGYGFNDHDGVRTYHRLDRLPTGKPSAPGGAGPALRGLGLFQVEMLRSHAALLLQLIDELPSMLPYAPLRASYDVERLRAKIQTGLDDIVEIASTALGPPLGRGESQFRRLVLATTDWLDRGGIARCENLRLVAAEPDVEALLAQLDRVEHCAAPGAAIPTREVELRIKAVHEVLKAIGTIIATPRAADAGRAGAELEQTLTLLVPSVAAMRAELDRLGTSPDEQEVVYFGGQLHPEASIAQFTGWVEDICAPFAGGGDEAPTLYRDELAVLAIDLGELVRLAQALERHAATYSAELRLIGARKQMKEIAYLLRRAERAVAVVIADGATGPGGYTDTKAA